MRTQADRDDDLAIGRELERKDAEIGRLRLWIRRIDNINDNPARFSTEIDQACIDALAGKPMVGLITVQQKAPEK